MEPSNNLTKMEVPKVPEDLSIMLACKINSVTRKDRHVKAKATKEEKIKKRLATGGPSGGVGRGGCDGPGVRRRIGTPTVHTTSWPDHYKPPYYYTAK
ncbi:hypothetical protein ZWY2020_057076 [Hordeum vulgare]|nr:hypothetical protein ZWY2020_057076 [Hordeum vulgare]